MKIWVIAWKDTLIRLRDRRGLMIMFMMPILLTLILGSALSGVMDGGENTLPEMTVAVYDGDGGDVSKGLLEGVLQSDGLKEKVTLVKKTTSDEVRQMVESGQASSGIVIPAGLTQSLVDGKTVKIQVLEDPGKATAGQIIRSMVTAYTSRVATVSGSTWEVMSDLAQAVPTMTGGTNQIAQAAERLVADLRKTAAAPKTEIVETPIGEKSVSAKQYYAAAMSAMFMLFNAAIGAKLILNERTTETLARMLSTPTSKMRILLGKFFGTLLFSVIQFAVMVVATRFIFDVDWGDQIGQVFAVGVMYAVAVAGLSMAVASIIASERAADLVSGVGVQICAVLGGSMVPIAQFPDTLQKVALFTPNTWALNSFVEIMSGTTWQALALPMMVLFAIGAAALMVGTWRLAAR